MHVKPHVGTSCHSVKFELKPQGSETILTLNHTGFPEGEFDQLDWGWHNHYWEPLKKFLA